MSTYFSESDLILHNGGEIYHLFLHPDHLADTVILVGDPERVSIVSSHFEKIHYKQQKREFITHTGEYKGKPITVISTGIGTDNIDIVLNELHALANYDFTTRTIKPLHRSLNIIRIGTSGSLHEDIPIDSILISSFGLGLDNLMHFYDYDTTEVIDSMLNEIDDQLNLLFINPYLFEAPGSLFGKFAKKYRTEITVTAPGFYAPQGRNLGYNSTFSGLQKRLSDVRLSNQMRIGNLEMETAGIYGLASILGHQAVSVNAILANRAIGKFSEKPHHVIETAILESLEIIVS
jgi:uridine phosphorylase